MHSHSPQTPSTPPQCGAHTPLHPTFLSPKSSPPQCTKDAPTPHTPSNTLYTPTPPSTPTFLSLQGPPSQCTKDSPHPLYTPTFLSLKGPPPQGTKDSVGPVVSGHIQPAEHLGGGDSLGVHTHLTVMFTAVSHRLCGDGKGGYRGNIELGV